MWELNGTNSLQVWIGNNYEEKNGQILFNIYAGGRQVCTFDQTGTNVFQYYHPDDLTSTSIQTDQNGNQIQNYGYSAFGQSRYTQSSTVFKVSRRYTGQVLDDATGLYYYNARYYDPVLGRFMQPDSIIQDLGNPQTYNRYAYCVNNPLRYTDPSGNDFEQNLNDFSDALMAANPVAGGAEKTGAEVIEDAPKVARVFAGSAETVAKGVAAFGPEAGKTIKATGEAIESTYDAYKGGERAAAAEKTGGQLVRFGKGPETAQTLAEQSAKAESKGLPHGVSTKLKDRISGTDKVHRSAPKSEVEKTFEVKQTGSDPSHHTVILPKPVTQETADKFNTVFKPKDTQ